MPTFQIDIKKTSGSPGFTYEPATLAVSVGDQIHWTNYDDKPHWPGTATSKNFFLPGPIAPASANGPTPSPTFVAGPSADGSEQNLACVDSSQNGAAAGTIVIAAGHIITIKRQANGKIAYAPNPKTGVSVGDVITWQNYDTKPHWPGPADNPTEFMENEIGPAPLPAKQPPTFSTSTAFFPGTSGSISYVDSDDATVTTQTIVVN